MATTIYPAKNNSEAIELNISNANQFYTILQGGVDESIPTHEGNGDIPSVAKALNEAAAYKTPLQWETSGDQSDLLQPRVFDGNLYVPLSVPAPFDTSPDSQFWRLVNPVNVDVTKDNTSATTDPTVTDDESSGYSKFSRWINTASGEYWVCVDATAGNAQWVKASLTLDELGTAAVKDTGTLGGQVLTNDDLPNSSSVGTASGEIPTNDDLDTRGFAQSVDSVATLRTSSFPANLERLYLSGYYGQGTPGGGELYADRADTTTADNGGTVFRDGDGVRWKRLEKAYYTPEDFGAKGDGVTQDEDFIDRMLENVNSAVFLNSTYLIDPAKRLFDNGVARRQYGFKIRSNTTIHLSPETVIESIDTSEENYSMMGVFEVSNVSIFGNGGKILGDRAKSSTSSYPGGMGINVRGSTGVRIKDVIVDDCAGDNIYIGGNQTDSKCFDIYITNATCNRAGRNNISIVGADGFYIMGCTLDGADYGLPKNGIDIEPDPDDDTTINFNGVVSNNVIRNNGEEGVRIEATNNPVNYVTVSGNRIYANGTSGVEIRNASLNTVFNNDCNNNSEEGIRVFASSNNTIIGNTCTLNGADGVSVLDGSRNTINGNRCVRNFDNGLLLDGTNDNLVYGNYSFENSFSNTSNRHGINLTQPCERNSVLSNIIRLGDETETHQFGIAIIGSSNIDNFVTNNDLLNSGLDGGLSDGGTGTITSAGNRAP